jgi:hypothetical protein
LKFKYKRTHKKIEQPMPHDDKKERKPHKMAEPKKTKLA